MFRVTDKPIDLQELVAYVTDREAGAIATFIGTTRNNNEGRRVIALDYDGYPEMAEKELARIGADAKTKWPICRMAIVHRLGPVQITEASVIIAVSRSKRKNARRKKVVRIAASASLPVHGRKSRYGPVAAIQTKKANKGMMTRCELKRRRRKG